jgi:flagellar hook-associated protein 1 FlgK
MSGAGFSTINTAITGLSAAQRALDATSQNIVNSNTPGYSRQRVLLASAGPATSASFHTGHGAIIGGVRVADVSRIRDAFLEATRAAAGGRQSGLSAQLDVLSGAQLLLAEPGDTGLQKSLDTFYNGWHDLAANPADTSAAAVVIQSGVTVADQLHTVSDGLSAEWSTAHNNLADVVIQTNQASSDLARLNGAIDAGHTAGQPVNELLDTRDTLVRKLATLVGGYATVDTNGVVSVSVNGVNIVNSTNWSAVSLTGGNDISTAVSEPPGLTVGKYPIGVESGSAAGLLATMRTDLPVLQSKVDSVASSLIGVVNGIYSAGFAKDGTTGASFFTGTDARTIAVVPTKGEQLQIAAVGGTVDGSVAAKIGDLIDDAAAATAGGGVDGPSVTWRNLTSVLGVQIQSLSTAKTSQDSVVSAAEDAVTSDAGVNLDEEMSNMMLFQRAYQASARVVTTADELLDTLINRTGKVGL